MRVSGLTVESLPRANPRRRTELPRYGVRLGGKLIGRVETKRLSGARNLFYSAYAFHPDTRGRTTVRRATPDFEESVDAVPRFWLDPSAFSQHLGL